MIGITKVIFPGEPILRDILLRAAVAGKKGLEVRLAWRWASTDTYVGGGDYELLRHFGYLGELRRQPAFRGSTDSRLYAHLTPKGRLLLDWAAGKRRYPVSNRWDDRRAS